eukprot:COSAG06_NODE_11347_length_1523_cov_1.690309_3_plen_306_part_01
MSQGEFKPAGYYAECLDLIRKLVLSSLIGLLSPGTVIQSFTTALFSLVFLVLHAMLCKSPLHLELDNHIGLQLGRPINVKCDAGPYPFLGANLLKLFADAQVFVVALVGLVLRVDANLLEQEGMYDREFYGSVMFGLLMATLMPALATVFHRSPLEKALKSLQNIADALPDSLPTPHNRQADPSQIAIDIERTSDKTETVLEGKLAAATMHLRHGLQYATFVRWQDKTRVAEYHRDIVHKATRRIRRYTLARVFDALVALAQKMRGLVALMNRWQHRFMLIALIDWHHWVDYEIAARERAPEVELL